MSTNEMPNDLGSPIEMVGTNAAMILDTLEQAANDIDELVGVLEHLSDLPEDIEQLAAAMRDLNCDLYVTSRYCARRWRSCSSSAMPKAATAAADQRKDQ